MNYWQECIEAAFEEAGITATPEQVNSVVECVEGAHENYRMYTGEDCIPNPVVAERDRLVEELEREKRLVHCKECNGRGRIYTQGPYHGCDSDCWKCRGVGKIDPRL